jgi:hypothetical protein
MAMIQDQVKTEESLNKPGCLRALFTGSLFAPPWRIIFRFCCRKRIMESFFQPLLGDRERKRR